MDFRSIDNFQFPARTGQNFVKSMQSGGKLMMSTKVEIDCSRSNRANVAIANPTAVAMEYIHIITNVFKVFLGVQPTNNSVFLHSKKNHSTYYKHCDKFGLFGNTLAAIGINETSKRGALHHHLCAWLGLNSHILEAAVSFPDIVKEITRVLDSQFKAEIGCKYHVVDLLSQHMRKCKTHKRHQQLSIPSSLICRPCEENNMNQPVVDGFKFEEAYSHNGIRLNTHKHSFTCFKGVSGKTGCRMSFPLALIEETKPVQLKPNRNRDALNSTVTYDICKDLIPLTGSALEPKNPDRISVYELKRPKLTSLEEIPREILEGSDKLLSEFVVMRIMTKIGSDSEEIIKVSAIKDWLKSLNRKSMIAIYNIIKEELPKRNGLIVPFNDVITALLGCNSSVQFLGNSEQSKNTIFYLVPYLTKDNVSLSNCIPIIEQAYKHVIDKGSVASDQGTDLRLAKHLGMRLLNLLDSKLEISDTQAVAALLGMGAQVVTDNFWYFNPKHHIQFVKRVIKQQPEVMDFNDTKKMDYEPSSNSENESTTTDSTSDSDLSIFYCNDRQKDTINENEVCFVHQGGTGRIFKRGPTRTEISIQDPYHYFYRGEVLAVMSRLEYNILIQIEKRTKENVRGKRGVKSTFFEFAKSHVLFESHVQKLRQHQPTPIFSDNFAPKHPGKEIFPNQTGYRAFRNVADSFALYYLTIYRAETSYWDAGSQTNAYKYDWNEFKEWIKGLESDNKIISYCRLVQMRRHIKGMKTNSSLRLISKQYRERNRKLWTELELSQLRINEEFRKLEVNKVHDSIDNDEFDTHDGMSSQQFRLAMLLASYTSSQLLSIGCMSNLIKKNMNALLPRDVRKVNERAVFKGVFSLKKHSSLLLDSDIGFSTVSSDIANAKAGYGTINLNIIDSSEERYLNHLISETNGFVIEHITRNGERPLAKEQSKVINYWIHQLCTIKTKRYFGRYIENVHSNKLVMMLGLPGTGKSFVIDAISKCVSFLRMGFVLKTAHYGVAAMNIGGSTLHKTFKISVNDGVNSKQSLSSQSLVDMRRLLNVENLSMLIIDEISNVPPSLFHRVNQRLQQIMNCNLPFGGLNVMIVGDFLQKQPPASISLVKGLMHFAVSEDIKDKKIESPFTPKINQPYKDCFPSRNSMTSNTTLGLLLFEQFRLFSLSQQQRASEDHEHTEFLKKLSSERKKICLHDFKIYKPLSANDLTKEFANATFIVSTNRERLNIGYHMAQLYALKNKRPLLRWPLKISGWLNRPLKGQEIDIIEKDPLFYDHFVQGLDGYLNENINVSLLIGNGTKIKYHSLSFKTSDDEIFVSHELEKSKPGEIITLPFAPEFVNVEIEQRQLTLDVKRKLNEIKIPLTDGSDKEKIIIPIRPTANAKPSKPIPTLITSKCYLPSRVSVRPMFPIQFGSSMTVEKAQGRTIDKVVICLSKRNIHVCEMDVTSIFVALSRVKKREDLRYLLHDDDTLKEQMGYIENLSHEREYFDYLKGFQNDGLFNNVNDPAEWIREKALHELASKEIVDNI